MDKWYKKEELSQGYHPTADLKFINNFLCQLWTSCYVGEKDKWVIVEGQCPTKQPLP